MLLSQAENGQKQTFARQLDSWSGMEFRILRSFHWPYNIIVVLQGISVDETRRQLLQTSLFGAVAAFVGGNVAGCGAGSDALGFPTPVPVQPFGPLQDPDPNGIRLPSGFVSRIVARSGEAPMLGTGFN